MLDSGTIRALRKVMDFYLIPLPTTVDYRGIVSLRNSAPLGPYSRTTPWAL